MDILKDIFHIDITESDALLWLMKGEELLSGNPFYVKNGKLYDHFDQVRDDVLGGAVRGEVTLMRGVSSAVASEQKYFFVNQNKKIKSRYYKGDLVDLLNSVIGNVFADYPSEQDIARISSVIVGLKTIRMNLFPYGINDANALGNRILAITHKERPRKSDEDGALSGVLRESFKTMPEK